MNNNIRIWCKNTNKFVFIGGILDLVKELQWNAEPNGLEIDADNSEVQLGSGMFDKNNKEIFEGDYLQCDGFHKKWYDVIIFENGSFIFNSWVLWDQWVADGGQEVEIIGNNKENPKTMDKDYE